MAIGCRCNRHAVALMVASQFARREASYSARAAALALRTLGLGRGDAIGIWGHNSPTWVMAMQVRKTLRNSELLHSAG